MTLDANSQLSQLRPPPQVSAEPSDRSAKSIAAAERSLAEAYASARAAGIDPDALDAAFAMARDCLAEAREATELPRRALAVAQYQRYQARHRRPAGHAAIRPVVPDLDDFSLCPDPAAIHDAATFMETLRTYRIWAGKPSYRTMERQCSRRFAASTICTALQGDTLPSLDMVQAVIVACGGPDKHQRAFASAWRRLMIPHQDTPAASAPATAAPRPPAPHSTTPQTAATPARNRKLYSVSEPA